VEKELSSGAATSCGIIGLVVMSWYLFCYCIVAVTSYIPCEWQFSWYTNAGHVSADKLSRLLSSYEREVLPNRLLICNNILY
jgi:hypothetical protein